MIRIAAYAMHPSGLHEDISEREAHKVVSLLEGKRLLNVKLTFTIRDLRNFEELEDFLTMIKPNFK